MVIQSTWLIRSFWLFQWSDRFHYDQSDNCFANDGESRRSEVTGLSTLNRMFLYYLNKNSNRHTEIQWLRHVEMIERYEKILNHEKRDASHWSLAGTSLSSKILIEGLLLSDTCWDGAVVNNRSLNLNDCDDALRLNRVGRPEIKTTQIFHSTRQKNHQLTSLLARLDSVDVIEDSFSLLVEHHRLHVKSGCIDQFFLR